MNRLETVSSRIVSFARLTEYGEDAQTALSCNDSDPDDIAFPSDQEDESSDETCIAVPVGRSSLGASNRPVILSGAELLVEPLTLAATRLETRPPASSISHQKRLQLLGRMDC